jgi:hypothetical protein
MVYPTPKVIGWYVGACPRSTLVQRLACGRETRKRTRFYSKIKIRCWIKMGVLSTCMHPCKTSVRHPPSGTPVFTTTKSVAIRKKHRPPTSPHASGAHHVLGLLACHPIPGLNFSLCTCRPPRITST